MLNAKKICSVVAFVSVLLAAGCSPNPNPANSAAQESVAHWENKLVRRPGNTPEDGKVYLVKGGKRHWVLRSAWISENGYKWPDDVQQITAAELDAIPLGDPIP